MVRALVGDSTMTSVRPPPVSARAREAAGALTFVAVLVAVAAFVAVFAGAAFFLPGGVRVAIDLRT